jgi:hypothetical protein
MDEQLERNKATAQAFYRLMFNECRPAEAIARYVGREYIQAPLAISEGTLRSSSTRPSPKSAASSAMASVIAVRKSANRRKRTQLPAAIGRRQIAPSSIQTGNGSDR